MNLFVMDQSHITETLYSCFSTSFLRQLQSFANWCFWCEVINSFLNRSERIHRSLKNCSWSTRMPFYMFKAPSLLDSQFLLLQTMTPRPFIKRCTKFLPRGDPIHYRLSGQEVAEATVQANLQIRLCRNHMEVGWWRLHYKSYPYCLNLQCG